MTERKWADDSFFDGADENRITTILTITNDDGKVIKQQLTVNKFDKNGAENPDYKELVESITLEKITQNTGDREEKKKKQREAAEEERLSREKAVALQALFDAKIQAFEIDSIKNSNNRALKAKLRKAQNIVEVNIYSMMIVMEELKNEQEQATEATSE